MTTLLDDKLRRLRDLLGGAGSALVAYSGGVDSALVLAVARQQLGENHVLACIGVSPSYPGRELRAAVQLAAAVGARHRQVQTAEHLNPAYAANGADRCYFCKSNLYARLRRIADAEGWAVIANGTHADDLTDHRHGMAAAPHWGVTSPLLKAGLRKAEVRALAREVGVAAWAKPAMACLASRVPRGTAITPDLLARIERAEDVLVSLGFGQFRVRHHGDVARIELPEEDLPRALACRAEMADGVRAAGYRHVTLDLFGFRREPPLPPDGTDEILVQLAVRHGRARHVR